MVRVDCKTFNQASYIEDALNGFCMQETTFPFVCTIIDDASTDGEQDVIRRYLEEHFDLGNKSVVRNEETEDYTLTFARHKTNTNCYFAVLYLKYNHYSIKKAKMPYLAEWDENCKYIAPCEGDDYWIDQLKLQKQICFLDENPKYSAVFSNMIFRNEKKRPIKEFKTSMRKRIYTMSDVLSGAMFGMQSICVRKIVISSFNKMIKIKSNGDYKLYYSCALHGDIYRLDGASAVYRYSGNGVASSRTIRENFVAEIKERYEFHKQLNFPNNKLLIKSQVKIIISSLKCRISLYNFLKDVRPYLIKRKIRYYIWYFIILSTKRILFSSFY